MSTMSEEMNNVPFLTLDPNGAAAAAAVEEAPVEEAKPEEVSEEVKAAKLELESLTPAEQAAVKEFSEKIDVMNTEQIMNYKALGYSRYESFFFQKGDME